MICLIFTRKKLWVGVRGKITEFLRFNRKPHIDYAGKRITAVFDQHLQPITEAYLKYAQRNKFQLGRIIPVCLSFPAEMYSSVQGKQIISTITSSLENNSTPSFKVVHNEALHLAYLRGLNLQQPVLEEPCVLLEALDGFPSLIYIYHPDDGLSGSKSVPIQRVGIPGSANSLLQALEDEFGNMGLSLSEEDRQALRLQIQKHPPLDTFVLDKTSGAARMRLEVGRSSLVVEDPMTVYQKTFKEWLDKTKLEMLGVNSIILLGECLQKGIIREFLEENLQLASWLEINNTAKVKASWKLIVKGLIHFVQTEQKIIAVQPNGNDLSSAKEASPYSTKPIANGSHHVKSPDNKHLIAAQVQKQQLEQEQLKQEQLEKAAAPQKPTESPVPEQDGHKELDEQTDTVAEPSPELVATLPTNEQQQASWLGRLGFPLGEVAILQKIPVAERSIFQQFNLVRGCDGIEFNTFEVIDKLSQSKKVIKYLTHEEFSQAAQKKRFLRIFEKEKQYYGLESGLIACKEGFYYTRPYIKGHTLDHFFYRFKLPQKASLKAFKSKDLKLIVSILEAVERLNVSHANLNVHNILIFSTRKLSLKQDFYPTFVGFTSEDCEPAAMLERVHSIFERSLKPGMYAQIREVLEL